MTAIKVGDLLPELAIPITALQIVSAAIAAQDFENVHHHSAAAQAAGTADIFMNILTTNGLVGRYLTDWSGAESRLKHLQLKLGAPNFPNDTMLLNGTVVAVDGNCVTVEFKGQNGLGTHVSGSATIDFSGDSRES